MTNSPDEKEPSNQANDKPTITLPGVVQKIVKPLGDSEKVQIAIEGADHLYREIRIDNYLEDADGQKVKLKRGTEVSVTIEAPADGVEKKPD